MAIGWYDCCRGVFHHKRRQALTFHNASGLPHLRCASVCLLCLFGLVSRMYALRCEIQIEAGAAVRKTFAEHLAKHQEEENKIKESASVWGITLETGIRSERVLSEFFILLPRWVAWLANRQLNKHMNSPQVGHLPAIKGLQWQGLFAFLQAFFLLSFLTVGFAFAAG